MRPLKTLPSALAKIFPTRLSGQFASLPISGPHFWNSKAIEQEIVQTIGDRFLTRIVTPQDMSAETVEPGILSIRFKDFTWPGGQFAFADADDAGAVIQVLQGTSAESALGA